MRRRITVVCTAATLAAFLLLGPVLAQTAPAPQPAPPPDPRLSGPTVTALSGLLALRDAELKVLSEDAKKLIADGEAREATWVEWYKALQAERVSSDK